MDADGPADRSLWAGRRGCPELVQWVPTWDLGLRPRRNEVKQGAPLPSTSL